MNSKEAIQKVCEEMISALKKEGQEFDEKLFRGAFYAGAVVGNSIMMEIITNKQRLLAKEGSLFCHFITNQANRRN